MAQTYSDGHMRNIRTTQGKKTKYHFINVWLLIILKNWTI